MADDLQTRRYQRVTRPRTEGDLLQALRMAIVAIRESPRLAEPRRLLRALATDQATWEPLALLLGDEARAASDPSVAIAFYEELADVTENLDHPDETIKAGHRTDTNLFSWLEYADMLERLASALSYAQAIQFAIRHGRID
ncbi:MAG: hypothetical protein NT062_00535, partial [Proteobacteria bacterium]|nr:hypothetical protein [Pseudomonadota bacterium]